MVAQDATHGREDLDVDHVLRCLPEQDVALADS